MRLYTYPITSNAIKVGLLLNELGLSPDLEIVRLNNLEQRSPEFLALNPNGSIPVLKDMDHVIWESNAILHYLAQTYSSSLYPQAPQLLSELIRWFCWEQDNWVAASAKFAHQRVVLRHWGMTPEPASETSLERFHRKAEVLEAHFKNHPFMLGKAVSIADLAIASPLFFWREADIPVTDFSLLHEWLLTLEDYEWWQQTHIQLDDFMNVSQ